MPLTNMDARWAVDATDCSSSLYEVRPGCSTSIRLSRVQFSPSKNPCHASDRRIESEFHWLGSGRGPFAPRKYSGEVTKRIPSSLTVRVPVITSSGVSGFQNAATEVNCESNRRYSLLMNQGYQELPLLRYECVCAKNVLKSGSSSAICLCSLSSANSPSRSTNAP